MGEYAGFISAVHEAGYKATVGGGKGVLQAYEQMTDYIVKQLEIVDGEELLRSQSVYEMIKHTSHTLEQVGKKGGNMREEVKNFANLQQRLLNDRRIRDSIDSLTAQAPRDIQDLVNTVQKNHGSSDYLNYQELQRLLLAKDYDKLRASNGISQTIIDKERLFTDLRKKGGQKQIERFLHNYLQTRLDVVSLADARETVAQAPTSTVFDERLQAQIKTVLDFVEDSLRIVPHSRREAMTLGDYIERHGYIAQSGQTDRREEHMNEILKRKIQDVLGKSVDINGADLIDWEYAGVNTNPSIHAQQDIRVKAALAEGKGYSPEASSDNTVDSYINGRAANELGEAPLVGYLNEATGVMESTDQQTYDLELVLRDARKLTELKPESGFMHTYYENELLSLYSSANFDAVAVEKLIQRYTELRLRECMLNSEFASRVRNSGNGHIYVKMLKEQIADELKISQPAEASDFMFSKLQEDPRIKADVEGRYNVQDVSNLENVGLEKLLNS